MSHATSPLRHACGSAWNCLLTGFSSVSVQQSFHVFCWQGSPYWEIAAGYVGALKAEIPFTNLYSQSVSLSVDEALITIRPRAQQSTAQRAPCAADDKTTGAEAARTGGLPSLLSYQGSTSLQSWHTEGYYCSVVSISLRLS